MEAKGHTNWPTTAKGNPSFTEDWLKTFELGKAIVAVRKITNLKNTFITPVRDRFLWNGRIHANFNQTKQDDYGVVAGRISANDPNLLQVPKRNKELAPLFRRSYVPDDGYVWSENDYAQQEYVVFAYYTRSPTLMAGYRSDPVVDIHQVVADFMKVERDPTAKRMNMGLMTGIGAATMAEKIGCTEAQAREYQKLHSRAIPETVPFRRKCEARAKQRGWIMTILGRRAHFPDRRYAYRALSRLIQGTSADITKTKMCDMHDYLKSELAGHVLIQCYDSVSYQFLMDRPDVDKRAQEIMEILEPEPGLPIDVPLRVDSGAGPSWGHATFPKFDWSEHND
jgi:DNA polymerase-1